MKDLFKVVQNDFTNFTAFQDEATCKRSNFFYHGFLFVNNDFISEILNKLIRIKEGKGKRYTKVHFKEIKNSSGGMTKIALEWLNLSRKWLESGAIKFLFFGINKNSFSNFWDNSWSFDKNVYLKSFEVAFNSATGWFKRDKKLNRPFMVSDVFYEYGPYKDERKDKIEWLDLSFSNDALNCNFISYIWADELRQQQEDEKFAEYSNFIQLTDILLGVCKHSFIEINPKHKGRQECIDNFIDIIEKFNNEKDAYDFLNNKLCRNFRINFFPKNKINKNEFLSKAEEYHRKMKDNFYCDRETHSQVIAKKKQQTLDFTVIKNFKN